jgi:hypothetical protein
MPWRRAGKDPDSGTLREGTQIKFLEVQGVAEFKEISTHSTGRAAILASGRVSDFTRRGGYRSQSRALDRGP